MMQTLFRTTLVAALTVFQAHGAMADGDRTMPSWGKWAVDCGNTGLCLTSSLVRGQSAWVDIRIVRDWQAGAAPLVRVTANSPLAGNGTVTLSIDGREIETFTVKELTEAQTSIVSPTGFRPIGGEGFWYPAGPATMALLDSMRAGNQLTISLPVNGAQSEITIPLKGLRQAFAWMDQRQQRSGSQTALAISGDGMPQDAPHAIPVLVPETLPPAVRQAWDHSRTCSTIDPAIFAGLDAIAAPLPDKTTLYLLPCGSPTAYNTAYVTVLAYADGKARQLQMARLSEQGPIASDVIYNARWTPGTLELDGLYKGSGIGDCGTWNRWRWTGATFALSAEASRMTCDGTETPLRDWPLLWPAPTSTK
ncbi:DUF1176 domain-containing protein [Roseibium suaedae]|uniref:DUF1176 domain-containing protein n=1 Tax=Roseibium suaedae TaxID=735517 RepID=A0A1M7HJT4_9HYPH|nr:DUF1176 domain-containing protein [Roseibium suaedae]SHM28772.1 Protein of unknown function [Roseibium suaedae]